MKKKQKETPFGLVFCKNPEQYEIFDVRINKPLCYQYKKKDDIKGSMVLQEMDQVIFNKRKDIKIDYFIPNNIAILLSISSTSFSESKKIYNEHLNPYNKKNEKEIHIDNKKYLIGKSKIVCNYLEKIQISIVFGYTAVEAFANISIPDKYEFKYKDNKGIIHSYDKEAIERWLSLREKISKILTAIYKTKKIENSNFWTDFVKLEEYRNNIIHQKSIKRTDFIKPYFKPNIEKVCKSSSKVLEFFYKKQAEKDSTNLLWPWLINPSKEFPLTTKFDSKQFEIIGNVYEGIKRKN